MTSLSADTNDDLINENLSRLVRSTAGFSNQSSINARLDTSIKYANSFLFQKSSVITNDVILFHRQEDRSRNIQEVLPYFLGIVSEEVLGHERELDEARRNYRRISARFNEAIRRIDDMMGTGRSLVDEAQKLGLLEKEVNPADLDSVKKISAVLAAVPDWQPSTLPPVQDDRLPQLRQEWNDIRQEFGLKQEEINEARLIQKEIAGYSTRTDEQELDCNPLTYSLPKTHLTCLTIQAFVQYVLHHYREPLLMFPKRRL